MKRIKSINGYTIYEATTQRDVDNYNCEIGSYNIYVSQDIKDFGLSNSYPEYDNVDSLSTCIELCKGSNHAVAVALADELGGSTIEDVALEFEIEARLDAGQSVDYIRDHYDLDVEFFTDDMLTVDCNHTAADAALSDDDEETEQEQTGKHWTVHRNDYRNVYYYCDCCGCTIGKYQPMHCAESTEGDFMVFCDRCIDKQDFLRPEPVEEEPAEQCPVDDDEETPPDDESFSEELRPYLGYILEEDYSVDHGGLDHEGETVQEFLETSGAIVTTLDELNNALQECGIAPVHRTWLDSVLYQYIADCHAEDGDDLSDDDLSDDDFSMDPIDADPVEDAPTLYLRDLYKLAPQAFVFIVTRDDELHVLTRREYTGGKEDGDKFVWRVTPASYPMYKNVLEVEII